ncbi:transglutaminase domain-containing protein [Methanobacterium alcaliphilum]|uniref:transglutaminase domain-containing protein n=1 Tax=Methanobacterium alcaliphilum TaxID=392018 RepID=UPI00200AE304|nr:transglutaminase domain-containing protein [Methanobacterium alcaliphilum]MCK9150448.1 transglutaminase domain-containing protein [Methanobacterium alcaliphilum]
MPFSQGISMETIQKDTKTSLSINGEVAEVSAAYNKHRKATAAEKAKLTRLEGKEGLDYLAKYINKHLNHRSGAAHTAAGVEKTGYGDCWGLSDWTAKKLAKAGYQVKVVQGANSYSSRHRWVKVKVDGKWINFEPSLVTKRYGSKHYTKTCARMSRVVTTYNCD